MSTRSITTEVLRCTSCGSVDLREFPAEICIHNRGIKDLTKPGFFVFPNVVLCMICGAGCFAVPPTQLCAWAKDGSSD